VELPYIIILLIMLWAMPLRKEGERREGGREGLMSVCRRKGMEGRGGRREGGREGGRHVPFHLEHGAQLRQGQRVIERREGEEIGTQTLSLDFL